MVITHTFLISLILVITLGMKMLKVLFFFLFAMFPTDDKNEVDWNTDDEMEIDNILWSPEPSIRPAGVSDEMVARFFDMGFSSDMIARAIDETGGANWELIIETLCNYSTSSEATSSKSKVIDYITKKTYSVSTLETEVSKKRLAFNALPRNGKKPNTAMANDHELIRLPNPMSDFSTHEVLNCNDTMCEIFLRLPPETLYKLILVSKRWLQIISSPFFRYTYITIWKPDFQLIGFFICSSMYLGGVCRPRSLPSLPLLSTSYIGDEMESSGVLKKLGYHIDSSNGLLLSGHHPKAYYVWDPSTRKHHQLPYPRGHFKELCMSLITEDCRDEGFSYKVIRGECFVESTKVKVETYSSKTATWSYSELTCNEPMSLSSLTLGRVIKGVVYWHATGNKVAIYDSNNEEKRIDVMKLPKTYNYDEQVLGEAADGCLLYGWSNKSVMEIWKLQKVNNVLRWNIHYELNFKAMWKMNPEVATRFSTRTKETQILSFLNQNSDSVYIRSDKRIFIYDTKTQRVEAVQYQGRGSLLSWHCCKVLPYFRRFWPSSSLLKTMP